MKLIVVIPALNEAESIAKVVKSIPSSIPKITEIVTLVIDDGSKDNTAEVARGAGALVVSHSKNKGVGAAFRTGLQTVLNERADIMVNIDADGQFSPLDIPKIILPIINDEADFVTSDRFSDENGNNRRPENMSFVKYWGNLQVSKLVSRLANRYFNDVSCGFRAYSTKALLHLNLIGTFTYTQESFLDLATKNIRISSMPVHVKYFPDRKSRVVKSIFSYACRISFIIFRTYRDHRPIRFFGTLGLVVFLAGLVLDIFTILHYFQNGSFSPYIFVAFGGVFLSTLGFIIWIVGLMADMLDRIRINQEKLLYYAKESRYKNNLPLEER